MLKISEREAVNFAAKLAPWLAPIPSAFFVARSSIVHLTLPWPVAVIVAAIVETLGLATVNIILRMWEWNQTKRKIDPQAPTWVGVALGVIYLITTLGLIVALEVWPALATYAPAMFPFLAVVGTVNLALIASQDRQEADIIKEKAERKAERLERRSVTGQNVGQMTGQTVSVDKLTDANTVRRLSREAALEALVEFYTVNPGVSYSEAARSVGRSKPWVVGAVKDLESGGKLRKNGHGVEVITQ